MFRLRGKTVTVTSAVHPDRDLLAVRIDSTLVAADELQVRLAFPYGSPAMQAADWQQVNRHQTTLISSNAGLAKLRRQVDKDEYFVALRWNGSRELAHGDTHSFLLRSAGDRLEFVVEFSARQREQRLPGVSVTFAESADHWRRFWSESGAVELSRSNDGRAHELERRIVLSQYLTAIQCCGSMPPQETGLTVNSWVGMSPNPVWERTIDKLSPLPVKDGVYLAHENCPQTFTGRNRDHPSMLGALGVLPGEGVDRETMRRTLFKVMKEWQWDQTWGWDYPLTAMTAARLGEGKTAIEALLMTTEKNRYLPNGHNWQRSNLPCYLPGNGGLLYAVAMMAGGWRGSPRRNAPGFPDDGSWTIRSEGLNTALLAQL